MSVDSPQKGFSGLQENVRFCLWLLCNSHISTRLTDKDSLSHYLISQGLWTLLWIQPQAGTAGDTVLGWQVLRGGLLLLQGLVTAQDVAVSLTWEEWERLGPAQKPFFRESAPKDHGNAVSPSECWALPVSGWVWLVEGLLQKTPEPGCHSQRLRAFKPLLWLRQDLSVLYCQVIESAFYMVHILQS